MWNTRSSKVGPIQYHWRRFVKKICGGETKILGDKVIITDECRGVSKLLRGTRPGDPAKSTSMHITLYY